MSGTNAAIQYHAPGSVSHALPIPSPVVWRDDTCSHARSPVPVPRPTIELGLDELLNADHPAAASVTSGTHDASSSAPDTEEHTRYQHEGRILQDDMWCCITMAYSYRPRCAAIFINHGPLSKGTTSSHMLGALSSSFVLLSSAILTNLLNADSPLAVQSMSLERRLARHTQHRREGRILQTR